MLKAIYNVLFGRKCKHCEGRIFLRVVTKYGTNLNYDLPVWDCRCGNQVLNGWIRGWQDE